MTVEETREEFYDIRDRAEIAFNNAYGFLDAFLRGKYEIGLGKVNNEKFKKETNYSPADLAEINHDYNDHLSEAKKLIDDMKKLI